MCPRVWNHLVEQRVEGLGHVLRQAVLILVGMVEATRELDLFGASLANRPWPLAHLTRTQH